MNYKSVLIFIAALTSCANQVPQLEADIPLVEHSFVSSYDYLPEVLSAQLDNTPVFLNIKGNQFEVGKQYHSATGKLCIKLKNRLVVEPKKGLIVVCKKQQGERWHYVENLL